MADQEKNGTEIEIKSKVAGDSDADKSADGGSELEQIDIAEAKRKGMSIYELDIDAKVTPPDETKDSSDSASNSAGTEAVDATATTTSESAPAPETPSASANPAEPDVETTETPTDIAPESVAPADTSTTSPNPTAESVTSEPDTAGNAPVDGADVNNPATDSDTASSVPPESSAPAETGNASNATPGDRADSADNATNDETAPDEDNKSEADEDSGIADETEADDDSESKNDESAEAESNEADDNAEKNDNTPGAEEDRAGESAPEEPETPEAPDDLQAREDKLAQSMADEAYGSQGGTGYDLNKEIEAYDPDASPEASSLGAPASDDGINEFNSNNSTDPYTDVTERGRYNADSDEPPTDNDTDFLEDWDDRTGEKEETEESDHHTFGEKDATGTGEMEGETDNAGSDKPTVTRKKVPQVKWKEGQTIDLALLSSVWKQLKQIKPVQPMIATANEAFGSFLLSVGGTTTIKLADWVQRLSKGDAKDPIGTALDIAKSLGQRILYTTVAVLQCSVLGAFTISSLPVLFNALITSQPMQGILQGIFKVAVPIINGMSIEDALK